MPKTALITGASRGLGLEWSRQLAEKGWKVLAAARRPSASLEMDGVTQIRLDVADAASCAALTEALGETRLDLLVNNAGVRPEACGPDKTLTEMDFESMEMVMRTNVVGPTRVLAACLGALARADAFKVVNVTSGLGAISRVSETRTAFANIKATDLAYRSSKAALNMSTACAALEISERYPNAVVVAMDPGWAKTDMGLRDGKDEPPMLPAQSVQMQIRLTESLTSADTGKLLALDGTSLQW